MHSSNSMSNYNIENESEKPEEEEMSYTKKNKTYKSKKVISNLSNITNNNEIPESISDTDMISTVHNFKSTDIISSSSSKLDKEISYSSIYSTEDNSSDFIYYKRYTLTL